MAIIKNAIPILEYDTAQAAVIMPNRAEKYPFPKKAVLCFDNFNEHTILHDCEEIGEFVTCTKIFPIYRILHRGFDITLCQVPLGSSAAVQLLDYLIGNGVTEIIAVGCCGALIDLPENHFVVPTEALRDEGTSYHYLPPSRTVELNCHAVQAVVKLFEDRKIKYCLCKTWTTDGFYRETVDMVNARKAEGCAVVEMECAGLAACAQFRGVEFGQILYTADSLANVNEYDERDWGRDSQVAALELALDAVCYI